MTEGKLLNFYLNWRLLVTFFLRLGSVNLDGTHRVLWQNANGDILFGIY
jgi:hypothetical protein